MAHHRHHSLGEIDDQRGWSGHRIADGHLFDIRAVDIGMAVAEELRAIGAYQVEKDVSVRVPKPGTFGARKELRIAFRQATHSLMAVHAAGNNASRACA
jgi:hypothetical protein